MTAVDYAWARPGGAALQAAGVTAVGRYVGPASWGKTLTEPELDDLLAHDQVVWLIFEAGAADHAGGYNAGVSNAKLALANVPPRAAGAPIYFAVDTSINPPDALPYYQGICSVINASLVGVYGEGALVQLLHDRGLASWYWQSESTSFPGNQSTLPITHIQQVTAAAPIANCDLNILCKPDVGAVPRPTNTPPKPVPAPAPPPPKELDMLDHTPSGNGYWIVHSDGSVWSFGDAQYLGGCNPGAPAKAGGPGIPAGLLSAGESITSITAHPTAQGYWLHSDHGHVYAFGAAPYHGNA